MGIQVYDEAPDAETLLMSDNAPTVAADDADVEEQAEQALSTVDSEFGRTTDPVRMYMREMGSVELLTREGEIEIAKRIEDGLKHMIQAISACPTTIAEIVDCAEKIERDEMRIDELIDGLIDPDAEEEIEELAEDEEAEVEEDESEDDGEAVEGAAAAASLLKLKEEGLATPGDHQGALRQGAQCPDQEGIAGQNLSQAAGENLRRDDGYPLHLQDNRTPLRLCARNG
jgi:RNA polymerase primary sigma factor